MKFSTICFLFPLLATFPSDHTNLKKDERIIFFPTLGELTEDGGCKLQIHGWLFEPEEDSFIRGKFLEELRKHFPVSLTDDESKTLQRRLAAFLVDNEGDKDIVIQIADRQFALPETGNDGHAKKEVHLTAVQTKSVMPNGPAPWLTYRAVLDNDDSRVFEGKVLLLPNEGVSVISDVDDTIKITEVLDTKAMLANTFLRPFRPAPGMADLYSHLEKTGATFHYVSGSPWQLCEPLDEFRREFGFPEGTFHLVPFRAKDMTGIEFVLKDSAEKKLPTIENIMKTWPRRKFILIGDSGEMDPEIYGSVARKNPSQMLRILIRDVRGNDRLSSRMIEAFKDVPDEQWVVFTDVAELNPSTILNDS